MSVTKLPEFIPFHRRVQFEAGGGEQILGVPLMVGVGHEHSVDFALKRVKQCFQPYMPYLSDQGIGYVRALDHAGDLSLRDRERLLAARPTKESPHLEYIQEPFEDMTPDEVRNKVLGRELLEPYIQKYFQGRPTTTPTYFLVTHGCGVGCLHCYADTDYMKFGKKQQKVEIKPYGVHLKLLDYFERMAKTPEDRIVIETGILHFFGETTNARDILYDADFSDYANALGRSLVRMGHHRDSGESRRRVCIVSAGWGKQDKRAQRGAENLVREGGGYIKEYTITISLFTKKAREDLEGYIEDMRNVFTTLAPLQPVARLVLNNENEKKTFDVASKILGGEGRIVYAPGDIIHPEHVKWSGSDKTNQVSLLRTMPSGRMVVKEGHHATLWTVPGIAFMPDGRVTIIYESKQMGAVIEDTGIRAFKKKSA